MLLRYLVIFLLFYSVQLTTLHNERRQIIERVRNYLQKFDITPRQVHTTSAQLENSNKISFGYNLLSGSPMCYTGECKMAGFTRSIFKLNYTLPVPGSCTDKLVPTNVDLDCLPGGSMNIDSEIINTVEELHKSISNKVQVSIGAKYKDVGFSYGYSKETRYILDTIIKNQQTSILTKIQISYIKLSMFEPKMELSDNFKYVIENMPCCEEDDLDIEEYVKDFIFDYYGFTYVTSILLGGVAQQHIVINRGAKERLETEGVDVTHEASISFDLIKYAAGIDTSSTHSQSNSNYNKFQREIRSNHSSTLGGNVSLTTLEEWSKTVPSNPIVFHKILEKYIAGSVYWYNNCGSNGTRGICEPTGYFQFGICKCKPGWTGPDCDTIEPTKILHGTLCGFDRSFMRLNCNGVRPWERCPKGWVQYSWPTDLTVCYKDQTEIGDPVHGTLCGLHSYQYGPYPFNHNIGCSTATNVLGGTCPTGYQQYSATSKLTYSFASRPSKVNGHRNAVCAVIDGKEHLSGTLCGLQIQYTINGPSCNGSNPGLNQCPLGYAVQFTAFNDLGFMVCVKK